jgi:peptidyl-prolyl cis-trans isomerase SurA
MTLQALVPAARRILAGIVLTGTCVAGAQTLSPIIELDRIVAVVNDDVIVESELNGRLDEVREQLRQAGTPVPDPAALQSQVLERLILSRLQLQLARKNGLRVEEEALNTAIERIAENNQLTLRQFREVLERDGFDYGEFREQVRDEILLTRVRQRAVERRVNVTEREIDNFLANRTQQPVDARQYRVGHILIAVPEAPTSSQIESARTVAEALLQRLRAGEDFAGLAAEASDGQQALEGGDLGWRSESELPTIFAPQLLAMRPGDVSELIRSPSGFHIVRLTDLRDESKVVITQTEARHVLIRTNEVITPEEARIRLTQLKVRIENGEDFSELARANSDDTGSATRGGSLGWLSPGDTVPAFERSMDGLSEGEISDPFETQFGWHIVQVTARRDFDDTEQAQRSKAREQIRRRKLDEEVQSWLRQLRDEAYVEVRLYDD